MATETATDEGWTTKNDQQQEPEPKGESPLPVGCLSCTPLTFYGNTLPSAAPRSMYLSVDELGRLYLRNIRCS